MGRERRGGGGVVGMKGDRAEGCRGGVGAKRVRYSVRHGARVKGQRRESWRMASYDVLREVRETPNRCGKRCVGVGMGAHALP